LDDQRRDGGTNSTLRTKEQGTHLTLNEHDDDDEVAQLLLLETHKMFLNGNMIGILQMIMKASVYPGID